MNKELTDIIRTVRRFIELESMSGVRELRLIEPPPETGETFYKLRNEVLACDRCDLCKTRKNVVFGSGSQAADLMFVGEAPGMDEDLQGLPFVGRAGSLLTRIIEAIGLKRNNVYIANILKCRPPGNRNPLPTEILSCEGYLLRQIDFIRPKVICALGKFAAQTLLRSEVPISRLRGSFHDYHGTLLMPTYHPAYLLRNPGDKRLVWEDMKKVRSALRKKR
ncbi:MAG: uracil-DNA glycosylase [Candidatus Omnitrophota bacterium]